MINQRLTSVPRFGCAVGEALRHSPAAMLQGVQRWLAAAGDVRTGRRLPCHIGRHPGSRVFVAIGRRRRSMELLERKEGNVVHAVIDATPIRSGTLLT